MQPVDDIDQISNAIREIRRRLDTLESPTGTQTYGAVATLTALVEDIQAQLDAWAAGRRTDAQIDAAIDAKIAAALAGNVSITGSLTVNGALAAASLSTAGSLTAGGDVVLPSVFATNVASLGGSRAAVWVREGGRMGRT